MSGLLIIGLTISNVAVWWLVIGTIYTNITKSIPYGPGTKRNPEVPQDIRVGGEDFMKSFLLHGFLWPLVIRGCKRKQFTLGYGYSPNMHFCIFERYD